MARALEDRCLEDTAVAQVQVFPNSEQLAYGWLEWFSSIPTSTQPSYSLCVSENVRDTVRRAGGSVYAFVLWQDCGHSTWEAEAGDAGNSKASLGHAVSSNPAGATEQDPTSKTKPKRKRGGICLQSQYELELGESGIQDYPHLYIDFKNSSGYMKASLQKQSK